MPKSALEIRFFSNPSSTPMNICTGPAGPATTSFQTSSPPSSRSRPASSTSKPDAPYSNQGAFIAASDASAAAASPSSADGLGSPGASPQDCSPSWAWISAASPKSPSMYIRFGRRISTVKGISMPGNDIVAVARTASMARSFSRPPRAS